MITISGVCPLFFRVIGEYGALPDYDQKFHSSDTILLQLFSNRGEVPTATLNNETENTSSAISFSVYQVNEGVKMYYASLSGLDEATYTVRINNLNIESLPFSIYDSDDLLSNTVLIRYSHKDNNTRYDAIFWIDNVQQFFEFRMEGGFKPSGIAQKANAEQFRNQLQELTNVYAVPYKTFIFTGGDNVYGLPYWFAELLNRVLCLSDTEIGGTKYVRSDGSEPTIAPIMEGAQSFNITVTLEKKVNDAFGIGVLLPGSTDIFETTMYPESLWSADTDTDIGYVRSIKDGVPVNISVQVPSWCSYQIGSSSTEGIFPISITRLENTDTISRSGQIIITQEGSGEQIVWNVEQQGTAAPVFVFQTTQYPQSLWSADAGSDVGYVRSTKDGVAIDMSIQAPSWCTCQKSQISTPGVYSIGITRTANTDTSPRSGQIIITQEGSGEQIVWNVEQQGTAAPVFVFSINPTAETVIAAGKTVEVAVISTKDGNPQDYSVTPAETYDWVYYAPIPGGAVFPVQPNTSSQSRTATFTFTQNDSTRQPITFTITQNGAAAPVYYFSINP
ncbi:hypothetical protein EZS27_003896 [termite gut metagenome]|uniref:BACON domain-containing protein n=1 Tax=termite gut metagenome TaxID=433724 RepID=A0A5J4STU3_9ZZZZ